MARLVESLLDWGEIKDRCMLERGEFSLGELAEEVGEDLRMLASAKGLALQVQACPAPVRADRFRMKQVLYNLVENAIKFTPAGEVTISVTEEAHGVRVAVRDTGVGIAETLRTSIFEAFHQADNSDSRSHNGLGLAIAQRIVEQHGSRIEVFSTAGEGACFHFRLSASEVHKVIDMEAYRSNASPPPLLGETRREPPARRPTRRSAPLHRNSDSGRENAGTCRRIMPELDSTGRSCTHLPQRGLNHAPDRCCSLRTE